LGLALTLDNPWKVHCRRCSIHL